MRRNLIIEIKRSLVSNDYEVLVAEGTNIISSMVSTRANSKPTDGSVRSW